ncbi:DinI-like family protein [Pantoea anthophila]
MVRQGSYTKIEMTGVNVNEDLRRLNDLFQNAWKDDSWQC